MLMALPVTVNGNGSAAGLVLIVIVDILGLHAARPLR